MTKTYKLLKDLPNLPVGYEITVEDGIFANYKVKDFPLFFEEVIETRWKPTMDEVYLIIDEEGETVKCNWKEDIWDRERFVFGNCFKTEKEALEARDRVRELLMAIQDKTFVAIVTNVVEKKSDLDYVGKETCEQKVCKECGYYFSCTCEKESQEIMKDQFDKKDTLQALIDEGNFTYINPEITSEHFPDDNMCGNVEIVSINKKMSTKEVLKMLDKKGMRPATIYELLRWWNKYAEKKRNCPFVALGSVWDGSAPFVYGYGSNRSLVLGTLARAWHAHYTFAAVKRDGIDQF